MAPDEESLEEKTDLPGTLPQMLRSLGKRVFGTKGTLKNELQSTISPTAT